MKILLAQDIAREGKDYLLERGYELRISPADDAETLRREIVGCDGMIVRIQPVTAELIAAADRLRVIARYGIGTDNVDLDAATARGIRVVNAPGANANGVAEHTVAAMCALSKRLVHCDRAVREGRWNDRIGMQIGDLEGSTVGVIGFGRIGQLVAQKCRFGFGMRVLALNAHLREVPDYVEPVSLEELLRRSDFVSLHVPATPETVGMIGAEALRLMKPSAFLINMARGSLIRDAELAQALREGTIAGAALDAFDPEPPDPQNPLLSAPNVLLSPHTAGVSAASSAAVSLLAAQGIDDVLSGREPRFPVNRLG